jgi:hypothetical protein
MRKAQIIFHVVFAREKLVSGWRHAELIISRTRNTFDSVVGKNKFVAAVCAASFEVQNIRWHEIFTTTNGVHSFNPNRAISITIHQLVVSFEGRAILIVS